MLTQRSVPTQPPILNKRSFLNDGTAQSRVEDALARLSGEDSAWNSIKPVILNHLARQKEIILPWAKMRADFPYDLILRAHEQHLRLRHLAENVDAASFIAGPDEEVVKAGTALTAFAVCLDDLIDGEARDLFPMIQRSLLAKTPGA